MIFVIDDDEVMGGCIARACGGREVRLFTNAIEAMNAISDGELPELIFLDILLDGPDGFALLAEMMSYEDTARIPVVVVTSLEMEGYDLSVYGVAGMLSKETMRLEEVKGYVEQYAK